MAAAVITDPADQADFNSAAKAAGILDGIPSKSSCSDLECLFGLMAVLFVEAPLLGSKPAYQVQMVIDEIEYMGTALSVSGGVRVPHHFH
ncbi:hypothetical protein LJ655_27635 [Paraburkholderia sp. MMS20-SJTN17]|uniref:Uncharacterized protein n=1 Tax=Paraburkholderia translucens TaxID=2886945 RepID=A0ABS8KLD2_9BURK|nr:hypothetical protein [Paraburkholderia sp. MMS20-SJTN17]MCC8405585.1 hypothetical protein [Paraburkholderia sp. MMS20-SJTN17]